MAKIKSINESDVDIKVSDNVDYESLKDGDDNLVEVVAEIPVSTSKRGWNYKESALKDVVNDVNKGIVSGFKGHQKQDDVGTEFPDPVTHWVGAKYDDKNKVAYVRGVVDKDAKKLKRLILSSRINQVSIFGKPVIERSGNNNVDVVGYKTMSIDWTPLDRAGMNTTVYKMASGEMEDFTNIDDEVDKNKGENFLSGELKNSYESLNGKLLPLVKNELGISDNNESIEDGKSSYTYLFPLETYDKYVVYNVEKGDTSKLYKVDFVENNDKIEIKDIKQVEKKVTYVPISTEDSSGEMEDNSNMSEENKNKEVLSEETKERLEKLAEYEAQEEARLHGEMIDEVIKDKKIKNKNIVSGIKLMSFEGKTKEEITGEMDKMLETDFFKGMLKQNIGNVENKDDSNNESNFISTRRRKI